MARRKQQEVEHEEKARQRGLPDRVFQHPLRMQILAACHQREVTPREFAEERRLHVSNVGYHFRALHKAGYLEVARKEQARGSQRHFYRAKQREAGDEEGAPMAVRPEGHLTWTPVELDEQGWKDLMEELGRAHQRSNEIEAEARERLRESREKPIRTVVGLGGFERPSGTSA
ncbi:MAG TPA: helix-turn-helix domain-containing protein [Solirubrobacterales bacterium]|nr:helix-turn-helix domain-containing protein [Solirubrobacterales bacterium]